MKQLEMRIQDFNVLNHTLPNTEFFSTLSGTEIEKLVKSIQLCSFDAGEYVFKQGSGGDALYIVYEGSVAVCIKKHVFMPEKVIVTLGPHQIFGEMALLDKQPHCASIRAVTPVKLFVVLQTAFELLCKENVDFKNELKIISERRKFQNLHPEK